MSIALNHFRISLVLLAIEWTTLCFYTAHGLVSPTPPNRAPLTLDGLKALLQQKIVREEDKVSILNSRLEELTNGDGESKWLDRTRIGEKSMVDHAGEYNVGRGLFATVDCKKGDLLTCYPGDLIMMQHPSSSLPSRSNEGREEAEEESITTSYSYVWGSHVPESYRRIVASSDPATATPADNDDDDDVEGGGYDEEENMIRSSTLSGYILQVTDEIAVIALPTFDQDDMAYAGHFANDPAVPPQKESHIAPYVLESNAKANAMHISVDDCHMAPIATKDIAQGEEILVNPVCNRSLK